MLWKGILRCCFSFVILLAASSALAYDEPVVNLGYTSFYDGSPPSGPGFYFQDYFQYYTSNRFNDKNGNRIALPRTDLDVVANVTQFIYVTTKKVFGANLGFSALLPWVVNASVNDGLGNTVLKAENGPGDLWVGPALQFEPIMRKDGKGPLFVSRIELDVIAPIGRYSSINAINPSSHFWSLNPYWAFTFWMTPKLSTAARFHYLWNGVNHSPNVSFGPNAHTTQAGQAVFADIAVGYAIVEKLTVGVNGYFFNQITDTLVNGVGVPDRKESVWAIGPGMVYSLNKNHFVFLNVYSEQDAKNRAQGTNGILRFVAHF
ncbi:SphA family protein [Fluoribacter dumoffii]|uniref:Protein involved in meta-pathway of phenol degradation n=1 Tax=Fluoribacter dumoffii TaxID=463 RepID=A0A377G7B1_9GAMM|nr:transporter [Fluoribacter dumoffii]STO20695.1 Protein involved in meta-pathway of phenol degradation [Fluoribacter dumoffii]